jgi:hypothetical protein
MHPTSWKRDQAVKKEYRDQMNKPASFLHDIRQFRERYHVPLAWIDRKLVFAFQSSIIPI